MSRVTVQRPDITKVKGADEWSKLELDLLAVCPLGLPAYLPGKMGPPPDTSDPDRRVRAGLIRYLMLGGCGGKGGARPHPKGVEVVGGWIAAPLDFEGCYSQLYLKFSRCRLPDRANLRDAQIGALFMPGCATPQGLYLHRLKTRRDVHLNDGFVAEGMVDLIGAQIGGELNCDGGSFDAANMALVCGGAQIVASVRLGRGFDAKGTVNFLGAEIGGQLSCIGGHFGAADLALDCNGTRVRSAVFLSAGFEAKGEVNFIGAEIGGQLACSGGRFLAAEGWALNCQAARIGADVFLRDGFEAQAEVNLARAYVVGNLMIEDAVLEAGIGLDSARIGHGFFWRKVTGARRVVDLTDARVGPLRDDRASWEGVGRLVLDGFRYERIDGEMSVTERIAWLAKATEGLAARPDRPPGPAFDPQPYVQLAQVLRAQGNRRGAADVLVERERRQRRAEREWRWQDATSPSGMFRWFMGLALPLFDWPFRIVFGYGHRPGRALLAAVLLILAASALNGIAYHRCEFAPNDPVILTSRDWQAALDAAGAEGLPLPIWLQSPSAQDYETFDPVLYGVDLVLPFDTLGQEEAWRASASRGPWGFVAFYSRWFFQIAGIVIAAVGAAVLTGLVGRRD